jgi:hypothetical protein
MQPAEDGEEPRSIESAADHPTAHGQDDDKKRKQRKKSEHPDPPPGKIHKPEDMCLHDSVVCVIV